MRFKKLRMGSQLMKAAGDPSFFDHVHVIFGGSGAVGGTTAYQLISLFEEAIDRAPAEAGRAPRIIVTAHTKQELRQFTSTLFRIQQRDHGEKPVALSEVGYRTVKGVVVELYTLAVDPNIPELSNSSASDEGERREATRMFLAAGGLDERAAPSDKAELVRAAIRERLGRPFTEFLLRRRERGGLPASQARFRSVIVGIPLASIASYKLRDLEAACVHLGMEAASAHVENLKKDYLRAITDDLARVADDLADDVVVAHTTAVGGMYDEGADGTRVIRLGFAHSALDERLRDKQSFAEELSRLYAGRGIKILITAAAIGVDSVMIGKTPPLNAAIRRQLQEAARGGSRVLPESDISRAREVRVYPPLDLDLLDEPHAPVELSHGRPLILDYVLKSGENGFFTVSNTDALYRVMRVTSGAELGLLLARTAAFGDDPLSPSFVDNVCYYTETDNSRQVFDLLNQPPLRRNQLSGLQPKALQDLGSAKHQSELHTLGLLILLHRLRTLDLEAIPRGVDLRVFNAQDFFESHSQALSLEHVLGWDARTLSAALTTLVTANTESDLAPIKHFYQSDPNRQEAIHRVLREVIWAARAISSLGSPVLYERAGRRRVVAAHYAAPLDRIVTHRDTFSSGLRECFRKAGGGDEAAFERFVEFNAANFGFVDVRPAGVLVTARSAGQDLSGKVQVFRDEQSFVEALQGLEPYTYFTTSGIIAFLVRLKGLQRLAGEIDLGLGSANEFRAHFYHDDHGRPLLIPGVVEAFRMVSEGLEKNTGTERLDGRWGYYVSPAPAPATARTP